MIDLIFLWLKRMVRVYPLSIEIRDGSGKSEYKGSGWSKPRILIGLLIFILSYILWYHLIHIPWGFYNPFNLLRFYNESFTEAVIILLLSSFYLILSYWLTFPGIYMLWLHLFYDDKLKATSMWPYRISIRGSVFKRLRSHLSKAAWEKIFFYFYFVPIIFISTPLLFTHWLFEYEIPDWLESNWLGFFIKNYVLFIFFTANSCLKASWYLEWGEEGYILNKITGINKKYFISEKYF